MWISMMTAVLSGLLMAVQGVFNTRVSSKAGQWFTASIVNFLAFLTCLVILFIVRDDNVSQLKLVNKWYLLGGVIGAGITYTVMVSMAHLGPAFATMLILIGQMVTGYLIELWGLFDTPDASFQWTKLLGVAIMIGGIVLFQWEK